MPTPIEHSEELIDIGEYPIPIFPTLHRKKLLWIILHLDSPNLFYLMSLDILPSPYQELADLQLAKLDESEDLQTEHTLRAADILHSLI